MNRDDMKELAADAVREMGERARCDPASMRGGPRRIEEACERLAGFMAGTDATNPAYVPMPEAAACVIALSAMDRDAYERLLGGIARDPAMLDTGTLRGIEFLDGFLSGIGDDHDWSADMGGEGPVVRRQSELDRHEPTLTPRSLVELVEPMLAGIWRAPEPT